MKFSGDDFERIESILESSIFHETFGELTDDAYAILSWALENSRHFRRLVAMDDDGKIWSEIEFREEGIVREIQK